MGASFRQSMSSLHTWTGLLLGWVLYFVFLTGTAGYVDAEIDQWMQPELPMTTVETDPLELTRLAQSSLAELSAADAKNWLIKYPGDYPGGRDTPHLQILWESKDDGWQDRWIDGVSGDPLNGSARQTGGGQALYRMHWQLHYIPRTSGEWIVGVATMFMLVALITGIIVHKKIFVDFFTFRPGKGQRSWLDAHNAVSVVTLPFQLMITYSGLIFLMFTYMPLIIAAWYGPGDENRQVFDNEFLEVPGLGIKASGEQATLVSLDRLVEEAQRRLHGAPIRSLFIRHPNDASAHVEIRGDNARGPRRAASMLVFNGVSGELLVDLPAARSVPRGFRDVTLGLHEGLFAWPALRALYVLSGLLGAAMIATGLVMWAVKRRQRVEKAQKTPHVGLRLVEKLNVATVIGLPVAIAAYFWANRLLPVEMAHRAEWEVHVLFLTWLALFAHAALRPTGRAWVEQSWLAAATFALLPLLNALTTDRHLGASLPAGDWVMAGFDLTVMGIGLAFVALAWRVRARGAIKAKDAGHETITVRGGKRASEKT